MNVAFAHRGLPAGVLLALGAATAQDDLQTKINYALKQSRPALVHHLREALTTHARGGELGLLCLAALHDGMAPTEDVLRDGLAALVKFEGKELETYDLALRLLVLEAWTDAPARERQAKADCKLLLGHQSKGGFGYTDEGGRWDLSNTQYAALGLRAARALGATVERRVWQAMADEVVDMQSNYGGFAYGPRGNGQDPYASMTVAGIAVLAICRQALGEADNANSRFAKHIARGWQWMDKNKDAIGDPAVHWSYYFHYGLERAAILTDVDKVGGEDWYAKGAAMLVRDQLHGGGWHNHAQLQARAGGAAGIGDAVSTAFAVLFLRRKFQRLPVPITLRSITLLQLDEQSAGADVFECTQGLIRRGKSAMPDILKALLSEIHTRRRAAVDALRQIAGDDFGFDYKQASEHNRDAIRKAELWHLKNR